MRTTSQFTPCWESLGVTLLRTGVIAGVVGVVLAAISGGGVGRWAVGTVLALWPALGGHFVELWFLNWVRPRISASRAVQAGARVVTWFVGGCALAGAMALTARAIGFQGRWMRAGQWVGGAAFIGIELVVHLVLQVRGKGCFYDGRG